MKTIPTSTNMNPGPTQKNRMRSVFNVGVGATLALLSTILFVQFAYHDGRAKQIVAQGRDANNNPRINAAKTELASAFSGDPLNQNLVHAGFVSNSSGMSAADRARWIAVMRKMGWRSTPTLQTIINNALETQNLNDIIVVADALLRRRQLFEQAVGLMNLLETEPATKNGVYNRLKKKVPWRTDYLQLGGEIKVPQIIDARIQTINRLQASGDLLTRQELAPSVSAMVAAGRLKDAHAIWRANTRAAPTALHDGNFRVAVGAGADTNFSFPFEWQFYSGTGFSTYPSKDGLSGAIVAIQWDGRGVPLFMSQLTSATPGNYRFTFKVDGDAQQFATKIGVRFRCGSETIALRNKVLPNSQLVTAETIAPVPCKFPWLDIFGQIQERGAAVDLAFSRVALARVAD